MSIAEQPDLSAAAKVSDFQDGVAVNVADKNVQRFQVAMDDLDWRIMMQIAKEEGWIGA